MANHAYVKSRKTMKPEVISEVVEELNQRLFKGNLTVNYTPKMNHGNAQDCWQVEYVSPVNDENYARRCFWLNSARSFEMRHGGGGNFAWWIDNAITNAVALKYEGTISDDGVGEKWKGEVGKYDSLEEFLNMMNGHLAQASGEMKLVPPEFKGSHGELTQ